MGEDKKTKPTEPDIGLADTLYNTEPLLPALKFDEDGNLISPTREAATDTDPAQQAFDQERTTPKASDATLTIRNGTAEATLTTATPSQTTRQPDKKSTLVSPFEPGEIVAVGRKPAEGPPKAANALKIAFIKKNRESLFAKLGLNQPKQELEIPTKRTATYLTVDAETLSDPKNHQSLTDEIKIIAESREFPTIIDDDGNLIIIAFSERGGMEKLFDIEKSVRKTIPEAQIILGSCKIENHGDDILSLTDEHLEAGTLKKSPETSMTRISKALAARIADPNSRIGSNLYLSAAEINDPQFVRLIKAASIVSKELGGTDELIGYEPELDSLYKAATDDETGIISLEGAAGMGKSRLRTELLKKLPAHILCSANDSDSTLPGASLVTLAGQLAAIAAEKQQDALDIGISYNEAETQIDASISLNQFQDLSHAKRIEFASRHQETVAELCFEAMSKLREKQGPKTLFVFEDLHHVDHISEPHIIKLLQRYSQTGEGKPAGKVLVTSRPEEMYQSTNFKELKESTNAKVITLKGLDLWRNDKLGYEFAYHSLPPKLREGRRLGNWYQKLARKANKSPWAMKTFMDEVQTYDQATDSYPNLTITDDNTIELKPEVLERIEQIKSEADMATYFHGRLARLDEKSRKFLQYVALMDEDLHIGQIFSIFTNLLEIAPDETGKVVLKLGTAGYISEDRLHGQFCKLQHENTKAIVLDSIHDQERVAMAKELYKLFKKDDTFNPKTRHNLTGIIAGSMPVSTSLTEDEGEFWFDYEQLSAALLADAEYHHNTEASYELASTILSLPTVRACIIDLQGSDKENYPFIIRELAIAALFNRAESARIMGQFDETDKAIQALKNIHSRFPGIVDIVKLYLIAFNKADMQSRQEEMKAILGDIQKYSDQIPAYTRIRMEITVANHERRFDDVIRTYRENKTILEEEATNYSGNHGGAPSPTYIELLRVCEVMAPFEQIRKSGNRVNNQDFDEDVTLQPGAYTAEDLKKIAAIADRLTEIDNRMKSHPLGLSPWTTIRVLEVKGNLAACLGQHETAVKSYSEGWRIADQLKFNNPAARTAKIKGNVQVVQALLTDNSTPEGQNQRIALLKLALETYSREGIKKSLSQVAESSDLQIILRLERIRAIGTMLQELQKQLKPGTELAKEFEPYITTAMEDFKYVNKKSADWAQLPYVQYYTMGYIGHILNMAHRAGINIKEILGPEEDLCDNKQHPYMNLQYIESGIEYGNGMIDLNFGEVERKLDGLHLLTQALRRLEHARSQIKRVERDAALPGRENLTRIPKRTDTVLRAISLGADTDEAIVDETEEYDPEFIESVQNIKRIALEILEEPTVKGPAVNRDAMEEKITKACRSFTKINQQWPALVANPDTLYHAVSYIGFIAQTAYNHNLLIDENIFDEKSHPYIRLEEVKKAYKYAERITDSKGEAARKSDSLSALIAILETKKHNKKRLHRKEKDIEILLERQKTAQQPA